MDLQAKDKVCVNFKDTTIKIMGNDCQSESDFVAIGLVSRHTCITTPSVRISVKLLLLNNLRN